MILDDINYLSDGTRSASFLLGEASIELLRCEYTKKLHYSQTSWARLKHYLHSSRPSKTPCKRIPYGEKVPFASSFALHQQPTSRRNKVPPARAASRSAAAWPLTLTARDALDRSLVDPQSMAYSAYNTAEKA